MNTWLQTLWLVLVLIAATLSAGLGVRWVVREKVGSPLGVAQAWGLAVVAAALSSIVAWSLLALLPAEPDSRRWLYGALIATLSAGAVQALWYGLAVREPQGRSIGWRRGSLVAAAGLLFGALGALPLMAAGFWFALESIGV